MPGQNTGRNKSFKPTEPVKIYTGVTQVMVGESHEHCAYPPDASVLPLGVVQETVNQDNVDEGRAVAVMLAGSAFLEVAEEVELNDPIALDDEGRGVVAGEGDFILGWCKVPAADEGHLTVVELTIGQIMAITPPTP